MKKVLVKVKKLHPDAVIPKYAKHGDAGLDLVATSVEVSDSKVKYGTGLAFEIPQGYVGLIFPRSSIHKTSLRLTNSVGVIDSGYRGEVMAIFEDRDFETSYEHGVRFCLGERIAQLIIMPYPEVELVESEELGETERGSGGFGHTGK